MNYTFLKKEAPIWLIMLLPVLYLLLVSDQVVGEIPSHWNLYGEVDGYMKPWYFVLLNAGIYLIMLLAPLLDPRKKNYDIFARSYYMLRFGVMTFMSVVLGISIAAGIGLEFPVHRVILVSILALIAYMGNYLSTIRPNWFIGIRTPWTLDNEEVWRKTHLLTGRFWFWGGILGILLTFAVPISFTWLWFIAIVVIISMTPILYSYFLHRKLTR